MEIILTADEKQDIPTSHPCDLGYVPWTGSKISQYVSQHLHVKSALLCEKKINWKPQTEFLFERFGRSETKLILKCI